MRKIGYISLFLAVCMLAPLASACAENALSIGYGFAAFNTERHIGKIEGGDYYDFFQMAYLYERPFSYRKLALVAEPFAAYVQRPNSGADIGFSLGLRYYPFRADKEGGFFVSAGPGIAYTTIGFKEQGTHLLFILQGGIGYRYKNLFLENRVRHFSNGGTAKPNWSVNANVLIFGVYF